MYKIKDLYDLSHTQAKAYLEKFTYAWEALGGIKEFIVSLGGELDKNEYDEIFPCVWVHKTAQIARTAHLGAPCIIGANTEVRQGAFIRGSALIGENCVVGNSTELKNVILFDKVQVPHYNYIGDSILGYGAHFGAGAITSNVKSDKTLTVVKGKDEQIPTGLKKAGAFVGDFVEIGCNSVLNPATVIGKGAQIYPLSCVRGVVEEYCFVKTGGVIVKKEHR